MKKTFLNRLALTIYRSKLDQIGISISRKLVEWTTSIIQKLTDDTVNISQDSTDEDKNNENDEILDKLNYLYFVITITSITIFYQLFCFGLNKIYLLRITQL